MAFALKKGAPCPSFSLLNEEENTISNKDLQAKAFLLFTFTQAGSPTCSQTCLNLGDALEQFEKRGIAVYGLSLSSPKKLCNFKNKHQLAYSFLSDPEHLFIEKLGLWVEKNRFGRQYFGVQRALLLFDGKGKLQFWSVEPKSKESSQSLLKQLADNQVVN